MPTPSRYAAGLGLDNYPVNGDRIVEYGDAVLDSQNKLQTNTSTDQIRRQARGILTENYPIDSSTGVAIMIDGTIYFMLVGLQAGVPVTGVGFYISTAGTGMSTSLGGLYSASGTTLTQIAASTDQGTAWNTANQKTIPFTLPVTPPVTGGYYVAILGKTATTMPTPYRQAATTGNNGAINAGLGSYGTLTAQTTLPASLTISFAGAPMAIGVFAY